MSVIKTAVFDMKSWLDWNFLKFCCTAAQAPGFVHPRAQEWMGDLMVDVAPHWERRGNAELCSLWQQWYLREQVNSILVAFLIFYILSGHLYSKILRQQVAT